MTDKNDQKIKSINQILLATVKKIKQLNQRQKEIVSQSITNQDESGKKLGS